MDVDVKKKMTKTLRVNSLVRATALELRKLKTLSLELQSELESEIGKSDLTSEAMKTIQSLDYLSQSLTALSNVWSDISNQNLTEFNVEFPKSLETVSLRELKESLEGTSSGSSDNTNDEGLCQIF